MIYSIQQEGKNAYLRDLSRNVARGLRAKAEAVEMVVPCWGYRKDGLRLVPVPEIASIVRRIFHDYLKPRMSLRSLCHLLNTEGILSPTGKPWQTPSLRAILRRRKYTGAYVWGEVQKGTYHAAGASGVVPRSKGEPQRHGDKIVRDGAHEAIVSLDVFEKVQRKLDKAKRHTAPFSGGLGEYLLSGLLRCGHCGETMSGHKTTIAGNRVREYSCNGYQLGGKAKCNNNWIRETPLVKAIIRKLQAEVLAPEILESLRAEVQRQLTAEIQPETSEAEELQKRIAALDRQIDQGAERILAAPESIASTLYGKLEKLQDQRRQLQADLEALERSADRPDATEAAKVEEAISALWTLREAIAEANESDLRNLLDQVISRVDLYFAHEQHGKKMKSIFRRGVVQLRPQVGCFNLYKHAGPPPKRLSRLGGRAIAGQDRARLPRRRQMTSRVGLGPIGRATPYARVHRPFLEEGSRPFGTSPGRDGRSSR